MKLTFLEMKRVANSLRHECIIDREGDICIRPMVFNEDGIREILHQPQPCEFQTPEDAAKLLAVLAAEARELGLGGRA